MSLNALREPRILPNYRAPLVPESNGQAISRRCGMPFKTQMNPMRAVVRMTLVLSKLSSFDKCFHGGDRPGSLIWGSRAFLVAADFPDRRIVTLKES